MKALIPISILLCSASFAQDSAVTVPTIAVPTAIFFSDLNIGTGEPFIIYSPVRSSEKDSVPLHLMQKEIRYNPEIFPPWTPYPWPIYDFQWDIPTYFIFTMPACGDSYHENGQLSSRVECVDSVMHGKVIYWNEVGHKTAESTYYNGHQIKSKSYDNRGRITSVTHYDYRGYQDGICITYDYESNLKNVNHYKHGELHGICETYTNGSLTVREEYVDNERTSRKEFDINGNLIVYEKYKNGQPEFSKIWNKNGILINERAYTDGKPCGTWLTYHDVANNIKHLEYYDGGFKVRYEDRKNEIILTLIEYTRGIADYQITYFENGDTAYYKRYYEDGETGYEKKWDLQGRGFIQHEIYTTKDSVLGSILTGEGFYIKHDTLYRYQITNAPWQCIQQRYVIWNGDTVRQDYCQNTANYTAHFPIYGINKFEYDTPTGTWVKNGRWTIYENNNLTSIENYKMGLLQNKVLYYSSLNDSVFIKETGYYENGLKTGEWITCTDSMIYKTNYAQNVREGKSLQCDLNGYPMFVFTYHNDTLHGIYVEHMPSNKFATKVLGNYKNGLKDGEWLFFFENGQGNVRGYYEEGIPAGKWYEHRYNKKGKMKTYRIPTPDADLLPASVEENQLPV